MQRSLKRNVFRPTPDDADPRRFCGCGLSRSFPFCDSSQLISKSHVLGQLVGCGSGEGAVRSRKQVGAVET